ncbi:hypothetical protein [Burkholderia guangdongensis]|uniref:hypothetical protein n=1 Tax=Burkholderia guangdongensis TaxID=1792500 RepID=UPI0015CC9028|nr:hypothetical protein [Burkholderia guangdongensis]
MTTPLFPDPLQMWRDAITKFENDLNTYATGSLKSQEVVRSLHQVSNVSLGMQQMFEKAMEAYLYRANLPSRKEVAELADALRRIEDKLDRLLPPDAQGLPKPRPARTRKPSSAASAPAQADVAPASASDSSAPASGSAPDAKPARRRAHADKG